jgi:dihydrofolate reductase
MAKLVFGMMLSLDGYVAGADGALLPPPGATLHGHFNEYVRGLAGILYGRRMYEVCATGTRIGRGTALPLFGGRNRNGLCPVR